MLLNIHIIINHYTILFTSSNMHGWTCYYKLWQHYITRYLLLQCWQEPPKSRWHSSCYCHQCVWYERRKEQIWSQLGSIPMKHLYTNKRYYTTMNDNSTIIVQHQYTCLHNNCLPLAGWLWSVYKCSSTRFCVETQL